MSKRARQVTLMSAWSKQARLEPEQVSEDSDDGNSLPAGAEVGSYSEQSSHPPDKEASSPEAEQSHVQCTAQCCSNDEEAFQPVDKPTLSGLSFNQRNFQSRWYNDYPWLSVRATIKKVFCLYCRYCSNYGFIALNSL